MQSLPIYLSGQSTTDSSTTGPSPPTSSSRGRRARSRSPSIPPSSSARHYSPVAVPYPVVYSSPSLIDSARSSIYSIYSQHIPPPIIPLSSSPPPSSSLSNGAALTVEQQQQLQLYLQLQQLQQLQQQHPPSPPLYSSPYNPLMLSRPLELPSMVSASSPPLSSVTAAGGGAGGPTDHRYSSAPSSCSSSSLFSPSSPSSPSFASTSLPLSSDPTQQQQQQPRRQYHHQQQHLHRQQLDSTVLAMSNPTSTSLSTSTPQSHPLSIDVALDVALDSSTNNGNNNDNNSSDNSNTSARNHTGVDMSMGIDRERDQEAALSPPADGTISRPRSVMDLAIDSAGGNPAGRRVRRNLMARFSDRWDTLPRNSRIILCLNGAMTLAKVVASTTVLIIDRNAQCASLNLTYLKVLIGLYAVRSAVAFPFTVYSHLHPRVQGAPLTARDINLERQRTFMEVAGTCLFFLSNYFLFSGSTCRDAAPAVFYLTVVYVILGYIVILIPVILCLTVILCLPLVLRVMRYFNLGPVVGIKGATEEMIASIPIVKYRTPATARGSAGAESMSSSSATEEALRRQKGGLFGFFRKGKKGSSSGAAGKPQDAASPHGSSSSPVEYLTLEDEQDAVCAICLCEYEDDEELRKMRCTHYFHKECVDEWLRLHRNCPLCKRDIEELADLRELSAEGSSSSPAGASPSTRGSASAGPSSPPFRRATS
ncbi:MAG: hypothetical protein JOS17DRAFT_713678 [Linnemannia elongata]|nr:MAG: hypothetical protein JOS17DRAFT_713678 [Linnemannia elongata]